MREKEMLHRTRTREGTHGAVLEVIRSWSARSERAPPMIITPLWSLLTLVPHSRKYITDTSHAIALKAGKRNIIW